jgi:hypothetical protein
MVLALVGTRRVSQGLKRSSASTTSSILSGLGAPPAPERTNILKEKSKGFLRDVGQIGTGVAAGAIGATAVRQMPALAPGLDLAGTYLPHRRKLRYASKGAGKYLKAVDKEEKDRRKAAADAQEAQEQAAEEQREAARKAAKKAAKRQRKVQQQLQAAAPDAAAASPAPGPTPNMAAAAAAYANSGGQPSPTRLAPGASSGSGGSAPRAATNTPAPALSSVDGMSLSPLGPGPRSTGPLIETAASNTVTSGDGMSPGSARPAAAAPPPLPDFENAAESAAPPPPPWQPAVTSVDDMSPVPVGPPNPVPPASPPPAPERPTNAPPATAGTSALPPTDPDAAPPAPYEEQP